MIKTLVVACSIHHGNTVKIAKCIAEALEARVVAPPQADLSELPGYDLIGFGSGVYDAKHHGSLLKLADNLLPVNGKKAFIFSTDGMPRVIVKDELMLRDKMHKDHTALRKILLSKGYEIIGEFNCAGWNANSFLKLWGGFNKGRPDSGDMADACEFARKMKKVFE